MAYAKRVLALAFLAVAGAANANLVFNGSFETNTNVGGNGGADDRADGWVNFTDVSGLSSPDVWDNGGVDGLAPGYGGFFGHLTAYDGTNFVSIASRQDGFSEGVESTSMSLSSSNTYRLSVAMAYDPHNTPPWVNPADLTARLRQGANASAVLTILPKNTLADTWQVRTFDFAVATSDSYTLILSSEYFLDENFYVIDDVSIEIVPEPATMAVLGLGALALIRRRRA